MGGGPVSLGGLKHRLKLTHLKISHAQLLKFSARVGRRLLKNQTFLDKLADGLDGESITDDSERDEEPWGLGDGQADLDGYEDESEGRLESTESEDFDAASPSASGKGAIRNIPGSQKESALGSLTSLSDVLSPNVLSRSDE